MQPISGHQTGTPVALASEGLEGVCKEHLRPHIHSQTINTSLFNRCIRSAAWAADISCMRKVWHRLAKSGMGLGYHNSTHPILAVPQVQFLASATHHHYFFVWSYHVCKGLQDTVFQIQLHANRQNHRWHFANARSTRTLEGNAAAALRAASAYFSVILKLRGNTLCTSRYTQGNSDTHLIYTCSQGDRVVSGEGATGS